MITYLLTGIATLTVLRHLLGFINAAMVFWSVFGWPIVWIRFVWELR
jgi:hypothetical protein